MRHKWRSGTFTPCTIPFLMSGTYCLGPIVNAVCTAIQAFSVQTQGWTVYAVGSMFLSRMLSATLKCMRTMPGCTGVTAQLLKLLEGTAMYSDSPGTGKACSQFSSPEGISFSNMTWVCCKLAINARLGICRSVLTLTGSSATAPCNARYHICFAPSVSLRRV